MIFHRVGLMSGKELHEQLLQHQRLQQQQQQFATLLPLTPHQFDPFHSLSR